MRLRFWNKPVYIPQKPEEVLASLPEQFRLPLLSMYAGEPQIGTNGELCPLDPATHISPEEGMWIHNLCRQLRPKKTVEIGLAYGFSTIYILAALHENGMGSHTAIDPHQPAYHEIGLRHPEKLNMADAFSLIRQMSVPALVDLHRKDEHFEFIFIDGNHRFDDVLVDFILSSEVCAIGGHIILDDMWVPAVQKTVSFVRLNRKDFVEAQSPIANVAALRKIAEDTRSWDPQSICIWTIWPSVELRTLQRPGGCLGRLRDYFCFRPAAAAVKARDELATLGPRRQPS